MVREQNSKESQQVAGHSDSSLTVILAMKGCYYTEHSQLCEKK